MTFTKDPDAVLDYRWDWSAWLGTGETISDSEFIVPTGLSVDHDSHDDTSATVWLKDGTVGTSYSVTNRITTNQGRTDDRTSRVFVRNR